MYLVDDYLDSAWLRTTEMAAIAAARTVGMGDRRYSDHVAVEAMRTAMGKLPIKGEIVIGEGERDEAPMLYVGEKVGSGWEKENAPRYDIAVDPLEGTNMCATAAPGAIAVMAAAEEKGLMKAPDIYMDKIVVGPTARGSIDINAPVEENLKNIAKSFDKQPSEITVVVLDRERHTNLISKIRKVGCRIKLISDGDLSAGIAAAVKGTGIHALMGIGGAPEGVLTAAAMVCLGGEIQAKLKALNQKQEKRLAEMGINNDEKVLLTKDLAPGEDITFVATGVTKGDLLKGVRFFSGGIRVHSLFMSSRRKIIRFIDTIYKENDSIPINFQ